MAVPVVLDFVAQLRTQLIHRIALPHPLRNWPQGDLLTKMVGKINFSGHNPVWLQWGEGQPRIRHLDSHSRKQGPYLGNDHIILSAETARYARPNLSGLLPSCGIKSYRPKAEATGHFSSSISPAHSYFA
jgi:hypothetical protein